MSNVNHCDICGVAVQDTSIDIAVSLTRYNQSGEVTKTMDEANEGLTLGHDYLVICPECQDRFVESWHAFLINLGILNR